PVKIARSAPRSSFGLPELLAAIHTSRQCCYQGWKSSNIHASSGVIQGISVQWGLFMRTKERFLREWTRSLSDVSSTKTWKGDVHGRDFSGAPSFFIFVDMDYFSLLAPVIWTPAAYREKSIMVPRGFVTDFASVPRLFWSLLPPIGRYGYAALFHDYVYWQQTISRDSAKLCTGRAWRSSPKRDTTRTSVDVSDVYSVTSNAKLQEEESKEDGYDE